MLLVQETIDKYGYDPQNLASSSHKLVIFDCIRCGKQVEMRIRYYRDNYLCSECKKITTKEKNYKPKVLGLVQFNPPTCVLRQATYDRFGYYPEDLSSGSARKIIWHCPECNNDFESEAKAIREDFRCKNCNNRTKVYSRMDGQKQNGLAPNGKLLGIDQDNKRNTAKLWRRKWRSTPTGQAINRLRASLKRVEKGCTTKNLPYSAQEFANHVQERLEARNYLCPNCQINLNDGFDIDHKTPLSTAKSPEEALLLFALDNLDVLCPDCNQFKKRNQVWEY